METDKKKYTFDDWLNNLMPGDAFKLYSQGSLDFGTLQQIIEAKERAFDILVELRATWKYDSFVDYLKRTQNPNEYMKHEIKSLETIKERNDLLELIHGPGGSLPVDGEMYQYLKECKEREKGLMGSLPAERIEVFNEHKKLNAKISYRFLQKLKKTKAETFSDNNEFDKLWNELPARTQGKIEVIAKQVDKDGRAKNYKYEEVKVYLGVFKACPELSSCKSRKNYAVNLLSSEAAQRLKKAKENTLSTSWQTRLNNIL